MRSGGLVSIPVDLPRDLSSGSRMVIISPPCGKSQHFSNQTFLKVALVLGFN